ncbi:uncharacterized protein LOC126734488 [Anthonomus grandis grandis]|uniref:uncharacterized protein LOC126734488 n=1 Tax=Anthonomus grandis grandis TaxID=2921223 RepID=UPI002166713B|nr:uncharacterized protein LOC126734488 [Anthonomus grandis grandis]
MTKLTKYSDDPADKKQYVKEFCKRMLKTQLFMGTFQEKRWVESVSSYRDVVRIDQEEKEFIENILVVRKKLRNEFSNDTLWIGITSSDMIGAPAGNNLWVTLPIDIFGTYWFKVKTVEFLSCEVKLRLEVVRPVRNEKSASDLSSEETSNITFDLKSSIHDISNSFKGGMMHILTSITLSNFKSTVVFILLLLSTIFTAAISLVHYLMEYLLKLMKEASGFIQALTPIIIAFINLIWKVIFGFYSLIVALFVHGRSKNIQPQPIYYLPNQNNFSNRKALLNRSSVVITPLDD